MNPALCGDIMKHQLVFGGVVCAFIAAFGAEGRCAPMKSSSTSKVITLSITKGGTDITNKTWNVWAGQKTTLTGSVSNGTVVSNFWSIQGGDPIKSWDVKYSQAVSSSATIDDNIDVNSSQITYYPTKDEDQSVTYFARVNGQVKNATATLRIKRPAVTMDTELGVVWARDTKAGRIVSCGSDLDATTPELRRVGIRFIPTFSNGLMGGTVQWVQVADSVSTTTRYKGDTQNNVSSSSGLDTEYPYSTIATYQAYPEIDAPSDSASGTSLESYSRTDKFRMYLMWKPAGEGIFVSLKEVPWTWSGTAAGTTVNGSWHLVSKDDPHVDGSILDAYRPPVCDKLIFGK